MDIVPSWVFDTVQALLSSLKSVELSTYEHCLRVGELSRLLAKELNFSIYDQNVVFVAGLLHDIGKMGINKNILLKSTHLDENEFLIMKHHAVLSEAIIKPLSNHSFFKDILPIVRGHHERIDGQGYPDKLSEDNIPTLAKVLTVCDAFDAMSQTRVYRQGLPLESVFNEMIVCSGKQFQLNYVQAFIKNYPLWIMQMNKDLSLGFYDRCAA